MVTNVHVKSNYDRLHINKALGIFWKTDNKKKNLHRAYRRFWVKIIQGVQIYNVQTEKSQRLKIS